MEVQQYMIYFRNGSSLMVSKEAIDSYNNLETIEDNAILAELTDNELKTYFSIRDVLYITPYYQVRTP